MHRCAGGHFGALSLALPYSFCALGRAPRAQLVIERSALMLQPLQALTPIGFDAVDAGGDREPLCTRRLPCLRLALDGSTFAGNTLTFSRSGSLVRGAPRQALDRQGQREQPPQAGPGRSQAA